MTEIRSRWTWRRWLFIAAILGAAAVITLRTVEFLEDAQMSLGLDRTPGAGIDGQLVNQQRYDPPSDSLLRPSQIHVALRLAEAIDSLTTAGVPAARIQASVVSIMNEHMASRAAYGWTRDQIVRALVRRPVNHRDSVHVDMIRMVRPRFNAVRRVYQDSLDRALLP